MKNYMIFADFDGTITMEDTLVGAVRLFSDPEEFRRYNGMLERGEKTLSQVVRYAFENAPSRLLPQMLDYVDSVKIRPGFSEFLDCMEKLGIPVVVISGGIRQFSERKLAPYMDRITALHAVDLDTSGKKMKLVSQYDDGNELLKKTAVMAQYPCRHSFGIGDSFTDMNMAKAVDTMFARDILAAYLDKKKLPYHFYETFDDVSGTIERLFF